MNQTYEIFLGSKKLGTTSLEFAHSSQDAIFGIIDLKQGISGYDLLMHWCKKNNVELEIDLPEDQIILTKSIPPLTIKDQHGVTLHWISNQISGIANKDFELSVYGISCPVNYQVNHYQHIS